MNNSKGSLNKTRPIGQLGASVKRSSEEGQLKRNLNRRLNPKRSDPKKPDLGAMLHVPSTKQRLALRQLSKRKKPLLKTADRRNVSVFIQCLERAAENFKNEASHGFLARKSRRYGIALSFKAARQILQSDDHWAEFKLEYQNRIGVDLSAQDRSRAMFFCLLHAMGLDTEPARKDASRYALEAQPFLDRGWTGRQFFNALNEDGGVTGLRKLRKASDVTVKDPITIKVRRIKSEAPSQSSITTSANDEETTSANVTEETPDRVIIEATLTSDCHSLFSIPKGRRISLEGILSSVGKTIRLNIDRVTAS